tara:strand:- start:281 stop:523 length:243 start_codon:yes stop_codon:yes gene_type:complete
MRKNQKFNKKNEEIIKDGPPWTTIGHFPTYNEAAKRVDEEREPDSDYDYKIKRCENTFRVKKRLRKELLGNKKNKKKSKS